MDTQLQEQTSTRYDLLISEIESSDGNLSSTLRSIYEPTDIDKFLEHLQLRIVAHDKEIERLCNHHYQGFIESVRNLLQVRPLVEKLKAEIGDTNKRLQTSGNQLVQKSDLLIKKQKILRNIDVAIEILTICLPVLDAYKKLNEQMAVKRYYPALKTLEQLEHTYLPRVSKFRFAQRMLAAIPKVRDDIKEASMSDLKDFLESIRKHSERIGEVAMKQAAEQNRLDPSVALRRDTPLRASLSAENMKRKRLAPLPPGQSASGRESKTRLAPDEDSAMEENLRAQDLIDFSPVYRCLHIYTVLGAKETFEMYYRKQRRKQSRLSLQPPPNMERARSRVQLQGTDPVPYETLEAYKTYFHQIIGFFIVEDTVLNTSTGLVTRVTIDELWDAAVPKMVAVLRTHIGFCTDASLTLQIKSLIKLFCNTLRSYGFSVSQLFDLLLEIRDQYSEILMKKWVEIFNGIFDDDDYMPLAVETEAEYKAVIAEFPYEDKMLESAPYPRKFPFSKFVPKIYSQVKEYIYACLKFSEDLHLSLTEKEDILYKFAGNLLNDGLWQGIRSLIRRPTLHMIQLIQISMNMNYLEMSCTYLEQFISNITGSDVDNTRISRLQGTSMFKDARKEAEEQIYHLLNEKINEFFEDAMYEWMLPESTGCPSAYITDLIAFLRNTFLSFTNLPEHVAQTACLRACQHMAKTLMTYLTDDNVKFISVAALEQFELDVRECEKFGASEPVPGLNPGTLKMTFLDLRQLLDILLSWDWTNYFADFGKEQSRYLRVKPKTCIMLLEKMRDADKKKSSILSTLKKNERERKKLLETILKQLHQLANVDGHT